MGPAGQSRTVKSVDTACQILSLLKELNGAGVTELANHVGISKGAVHCHLATLVENELVVKENDTYSLSLRFLEFGDFAKRNIEILEMVKPELQSLAEENDARSQFVVEEHGQGVYVTHYIAESSHVPLAPIQQGGHFSLHCTSSGKSILAFLPKDRIEEIIAMHGLSQTTDHTITDYDRLMDELEEIRDRGVALNDRENQPGLRAVGAPIRDANGYPLGAISVSMPASRMKDDKFHSHMPELVRDAANVIEVNANIQMNTV